MLEESARKGSCKLRVCIPNAETKVYSCDEVRQLYEMWKEAFRKENDTDTIIKMGFTDPCYERYYQQLDEFLNQCKCQ